MMKRASALLTLIIGVVFSYAASAQEVTLKLHHFMPQQSNIPKNFFEPWAEKIAAESGGRLKIQLYPSMQLGGKPPSLYGQAKDGMVDIAWTITGYTPGRFSKSEVFELPFVGASGEATSKAAWAFYEKHLKDEYDDVKVLAIHTHGPGLFHSKNPINTLDDLKGMKLRGPTRHVNSLIKALGATAIGMPIPAAPAALAKGVIDGVVVPWEVLPAFKIPELVGNHTGFKGDRGLYTSIFVLAMNKAKYEMLPADLKKVIDNNAGLEASGWIGRTHDSGDVSGYEFTKKTGNNIHFIEEKDLTPWHDAAESVARDWIESMKSKGVDGEVLYNDAKALIAKHSK